MDDYQVNSIALKTLKQRCEYLQRRLNAVEEENCRLKLEKAQDLNTKTSKGFDNLEERIIILNKEKSQMAHQIQMITNENSTLWAQLSKVIPENNISSLKFSVPAAPGSQMISQYDKTSNDCSTESLEEISLKLINGIIMGKNELEKQYSQMVDLQKENIAEESFSITPKQIDNRIAAKNLKDYIQKLKDFKQDLLKQKNELSRAVMLVKNSPILLRQTITVNNRDISNFNHTNYHGEHNLQTQDSGRLGNGDEQDSTGICPICGECVAELSFYDHVRRYFDDDNNFEGGIASCENIQ